jgi:hypothetical protein
MAAPATALSMTTSQGGACHMNRSKKSVQASAKSAAPVMPVIQTGR